MPKPPADTTLHKTLMKSVSASGDEGTLEAQLLLWFLRHVMAVEPLDSYEFVFDDASGPIDGLLIDESQEVDEEPTLFLFEAKAGTAPMRIDARVVQAAFDAKQKLMATGPESFDRHELSSTARRLEIGELIAAKTLTPVPVIVAAGRLTPGAKKKADDLSVRVFDLEMLAGVAAALEVEGMKEATVRVAADEAHRLTSQTRLGAVTVCAVKATEVAEWPGIEDRSLFGLNVRRQLKAAAFKTGLSRSIDIESEHRNFIAYHNGLTVVCGSIDTRDPREVVVKNLSVVNGAQSVIALWELRDKLTEDVEVIVKFVEVGDNRQLPLDVAQRSNTQTAVNPRNLRSLDGRQQSLEKEFADKYGDEYRYVTRPDVALDKATPAENIPNDDAAQWLCAVYAQRPWLAVKRTELFRAPNYSIVFPPHIQADHVLLSKLIHDAVEEEKVQFPEAYRSSWALTSLVAIYLVGQILREDGETRSWLSKPWDALNDRPGVVNHLEGLAAFCADALTSFRKHRLRRDRVDEFKVDFKSQSVLRALANDVVTSYLDARR